LLGFGLTWTRLEGLARFDGSISDSEEKGLTLTACANVMNLCYSLRTKISWVFVNSETLHLSALLGDYIEQALKGQNTLVCLKVLSVSDGEKVL
jgi:hypothetical protein